MPKCQPHLPATVEGLVTVGSADAELGNGLALQADHVSKRYRSQGRWALRDVSLGIATGSLTALVGPNGAGKSTLIKCWLGFERPTSGSVTTSGRDPVADPDHALARVAYLPQSAGLYKSLTVEDHLSLGSALRQEFAADWTRARLQQIGIPLNAQIRTLSGGQQAQVALAIALGTQAGTIVLDEPLASLDPLARREFMSLLVEVVREGGRTAVLSSHVVGDVADICDRTVVLVDGRIAADLELVDLLNNHRVVGSEASAANLPVIGRFPTVRGQPATLVRTEELVGSRATAEEVAMGYIARSLGDRA